MVLRFPLHALAGIILPNERLGTAQRDIVWGALGARSYRFLNALGKTEGSERRRGVRAEIGDRQWADCVRRFESTV